MNTPEQRQQIADFIGKQHVLTLCAGDGLDMWCANCFYVFDAATMALWLMTEPHTRHGGLMLNNGRVVGTIAPKPKSIALIRGVQYRAEAVLLSGEEAEAARARYCKRFPIAPGGAGRGLAAGSARGEDDRQHPRLRQEAALGAVYTLS